MNTRLPPRDRDVYFSAPLVAWMVVLADRPLARLVGVIDSAATMLRRLSGPVDTWLTNRQRSARDLQQLASMSDRELHDIGISRASVRAVAQQQWQRDWPS